MPLLLTLSAFGAAGLASRTLALGISGIKLNEKVGGTVAWTAGWIAAGYSFYEWRERQETLYMERLQYLVDRKERRDKWDAIYFDKKME